MSEHKYLTDAELSAVELWMRGDITKRDVPKDIVSRLTADVDSYRAELKAAQEEKRKNLELWDADAKDKDEEIARLQEKMDEARSTRARLISENDDLGVEIAKLREEKEKDGLRLLFRDKVAKSMQDELDRMRKALEEIASGWTLNESEMQAIARNALNRQTAQQEKTNWKVDGFGLQNPRKVEE